MAEHFASPVLGPAADLRDVTLRDESATPKWRAWEDPAPVALGKAQRRDADLVFSVAPGEWLILGDRPGGIDVVDLTHVRAMFRLIGTGARAMLEHVCAIDLSDEMTPNGAAARTLIAGVATELVRDDTPEGPSYLLLMSRSFARHVWDRLVTGSRHW